MSVSGRAVVVAGLSLVLTACSGRPDPPNLLLVTLDTTRADRIGCYGHATAATPNLDRLAAEGALVEHAIAVTPLTLPSHASMMTGLYPPSHGVRDNADFRLPESVPTLAEHLGSRGYATAGVVGSYVLSATFGLARGFDVYDEPHEGEANAADGQPVALVPMLERRAGEVTDVALQLVERELAEPFFLWVHYFDPHAEYDPPGEFARRFAGRPYDGEIAYVDEQVGRLLDALQARGALDDTLVVVTADHGESLEEHGERTHGLFVYDAAVRVPLLLRYPGRIEPERRIARVASGVDLPPTVLELLDLPPMEAVQGSSFAPALRGEPMPAREPVYSEAQMPLRSYGWSPLYALRDARRKFIDAPQPELYDLIADRDETDNLAGRYGDEIRDWRRRLGAMRESWPEPGAGAQQPMDAASRERLETLGYLSTAAPAREREARDPKRLVELHNALIDARVLLGQRDTAAAEPILRHALEADAENPTALYMMGLLLCTTERCGEGLELLTRASRSSPGMYEIQRNLANTLQRQGRLQEAAAAYRAAIAIRPMAGEHLELGKVLYHAGDAAGAVAALRLAESGGDGSAVLQATLGLSLGALGDLDGARAALDRAVEIDPGYTAAWNQLGVLAEGRADFAAARDHYARALETDPRDQSALFNLSNVALRLGDAGQAEQVLQRLLEVRPDYPSGQYLQAQIELAQGDPEGAREALRAFLAQPNADRRMIPAAEQMLARLGE